MFIFIILTKAALMFLNKVLVVAYLIRAKHSFSSL